jgi:hypothetical protein
MQKKRYKNDVKYIHSDVPLPEAMYTRLRRIAFDKGISYSMLIEQILVLYLSELKEEKHD